MNIPIFEGVGLFFVEPFSDFFAEHIDVGLVDVPAFVDQRDGVVNWDVLQLLLFLLPVFVQNEKKFFSSTC